MSTIDLTSRDWVALSTKRIIYNIDPSINVNIVYTSNGGMKIIINNINEFDIDRLQFLTNNDYNKNYLYLEKISVYINSNTDPLEIPGLDNICTSMFNNSDINSFLSSEKVHTPFASNNIYNNYIQPNTITFNNLVDNLTINIPYVQSTINCIKSYSLVLNPDAPPQENKTTNVAFPTNNLL